MFDESLYEPQKMVTALEDNPVPKQFLQQTFFKRNLFHETEHVTFDVEVTMRQVAGYTHPSADAKVVERGGYSTKVVEPAYIKEMVSLRAQDLRKRLPGEDPYHPMSVQDREAVIVGRDQRTLDDRINRREELMCAEALLTGKVVVKCDGIDTEVDFGYKLGDHVRILTGSSAWNNADGDPMLDLKRFKTEVNKRCGVRPTMAIVGAEVGNVIIDNPKVFKRLDNRRIDMGKIDPQTLPNGVDYLGTLKPSNLDIYVYEEWYYDPVTKTDKPVIPDDVVLIGSPEADCSMHYGLIENLDCLLALRRFPSKWDKANRSTRYIQLECAPMPCIKNPNSFMVAHVLA